MLRRLPQTVLYFIWICPAHLSSYLLFARWERPVAMVPHVAAVWSPSRGAVFLCGVWLTVEEQPLSPVLCSPGGVEEAAGVAAAWEVRGALTCTRVSGDVAVPFLRWWRSNNIQSLRSLGTWAPCRAVPFLRSL